MDQALAAVAETLASEFGDLQSGTVVRVLTDCVDEFPHDDQHFIEQAARAQLSLLRLPSATRQATAGHDSLDVSLHDSDLAEEVELTAHLIVAANESDIPLCQEEVDQVLGVTAHPGPVIPHQRLTRPK